MCRCVRLLDPNEISPFQKSQNAKPADKELDADGFSANDASRPSRSRKRELGFNGIDGKKRLVLFLINDKCSARWLFLKPQNVERETKIIPVILDRRRVGGSVVERRSEPVRTDASESFGPRK